MEELKVFLSCGESSGETYALNFIQSLKKILKNKTLNFYAVGSKLIKNEAEIIYDYEEFTVVGIAEVIKHLPDILEALKKIKNFLQESKPDFLILIDSPDFNFKIAKFAYQLNIPVFYFVSPQVWAWRTSRVKFIKKYIKKMFVLFPFEVDFYKQFGINVYYAGHPLAEKIKKFKSNNIFDNNKKYIGLLPGSRNSEIDRMLNIFIEAAKLIKKNFPEFEFLLPVANSLNYEQIKEKVFKKVNFINVIKGNSYEVMNVSKLIITASGTASLEASLFGNPLIICYKVNFLSYILGRILIKVPYIGMPNLLLGEKNNPELIQEQLTPFNIYLETKKILTNPQKLIRISNKNKKLLDLLYKENIFENCSNEILKFLNI